VIGSRCLHFRSDAAAGIVCVATRRAARATGCGILHAARQRSWRTNARSSTGASTAAFDVKQTANAALGSAGEHRPRQVGTSRDALGRPGRDPTNLATGTRLVALPFDQFVTTIRAGPSVRRRRRGGHDSVGRTAARPMNDARLVRGRGGSGALGPLPHIGEPRVGPGLTTTRLRERGPCRGSSQCVEQSTTRPACARGVELAGWTTTAPVRPPICRRERPHGHRRGGRHQAAAVVINSHHAESVRRGCFQVGRRPRRLLGAGELGDSRAVAVIDEKIAGHGVQALPGRRCGETLTRGSRSMANADIWQRLRRLPSPDERADRPSAGLRSPSRRH
jgi:hypothetical protein